MKNALNISIEKPCSEKFENFTVTPNGGFCHSCDKEVIDFTTLSDKDLIDYFNNTSKATCGRFKKSQLKSYEENSFATMNTNLLSRSIGLMGFSLLALCTVPELQAQETAVTDSPIRTKLFVSQNSEIVDATLFEKHKVTGTVLDEGDLPLPGVNVVLQGTTEGTVTDFDGRFEFPRALEVGDTLVFSYIGYDIKEYTVTDSGSEAIDITITFDLSDIELMGEVVVGGAYKTKRNVFQKFANLFR